MPVNYMELDHLAEDVDASSSEANLMLPPPAPQAEDKERTNTGFRNYLEQFRKRQPSMSKSESFRQARAKYNTLSQTSKARYEPVTTRRPRAAMTNEPTDMAYTGNNGNGKGNLARTAGFQNYVKLYMCKNPGISKCDATKKALNLYKKLPESTKAKYRDLGYDFKCCPKKSACPKKKSSGCPRPKKCCPKPPSCCPQPPPPFCSPCEPKPACKPCPASCGKPKCCKRPTCCGAGGKKDSCPKKKSPKKKACCPN